MASVNSGNIFFKSILLTGCIFFRSLFCFAQGNSFTELQSAISLNSFKSELLYANGNSLELVSILPQQSYSYTIGAVYGYKFDSNILLETGLTFHQYRTVLSFEGHDDKTIIPLKLNYLFSLPISLGYVFSFSHNERFFIKSVVGIDVGFNGAQAWNIFKKSGDFEFEETVVYEYNYDVTFLGNNLLNPFLFFDGSIASGYKISERIYIQLDFSAHLGLRNMHLGYFDYLNAANNNYQQGLQIISNGTYYNLGISLGYNFGGSFK